MLSALRRVAATRKRARGLCSGLLAQGRRPEFFSRYKVADTLDGRFDLVALHAWVVLDRVGSNHGLRQSLIDEIFLSFDEGLRLLGTGDAGMNRRLRVLAEAFFGRLHAYNQAATPQLLTEAILRNLFRGAMNYQKEATALAQYAWSARSHLDISRGGEELEFGPLPNI